MHAADLSSLGAPRCGLEGSDLPVQLVERAADLIQDVMPARCQAVHPSPLRPLRLSRAQPSAPRHSREYRIERARTQVIAVVLQFLEHPLPIDALLFSVMKNMDLPKGEEELAHDRIAHARDHSIRVGAIRSTEQSESRAPFGTLIVMDAIAIFGVVSVTAMLVFYALEERGTVWTRWFAGACLASSAYGFLQGAWPFGIVESVWTGVAIRRWRATTQPARPRPDAVPIACNMTAFSPDERERYRQLRDRVMHAVSVVVEAPTGFSLTVSDSLPSIDVAEWLMLERRCCPFLDLTLHLNHASVTTVDLHGGPGTTQFLRGEFPQFALRHVAAKVSTRE